MLRKEEAGSCKSTCEAKATKRERELQESQVPKLERRHGNRSERKRISGSRKTEAAPERTTVRGSREEGNGRNSRLSSQNLNANRTKGRGAQGKHLREVERRKKVSTCGTAVGAKQGRTKGNKQKAEY